MSGKALQITGAERVLRANLVPWSAVWLRLFRTFEIKLGYAFAMVFSGAQAATRVVGPTGVSLAVVDDVMARALAVPISGTPPAR